MSSSSSMLTNRTSVPERPSVSWLMLDRHERLAQLPALATLIAWFAYTRLYFFLHPRGLTVDASLFMYLTGKPDPTCGLTRTFAWMWRGDLGAAVRVYPLGPLVFLGTAALVVYLLVAVATGRRLAIKLPRLLWMTVVAVSAVAVAANWAAKLIWLGM